MKMFPNTEQSRASEEVTYMCDTCSRPWGLHTVAAMLRSDHDLSATPGKVGLIDCIEILKNELDRRF